MVRNDIHLDKVALGTNNLVWIGETHGITNNFLAYKQLIQELGKSGFRTIALEYPEELEHFSDDMFMSYSDYGDGRFSIESLDFFRWLQSSGLKIICFDVRLAVKSQQESENAMAANLMSKLNTGDKALIISGSFHGRRRFVKDVIPQAGIVEKAGYGILSIGLKYSGGQFYNFGLKEKDNLFLDFDDQNLPFGTIIPNTNKIVDIEYWFHVGKAVPITLLSPTVI